MGEREVPLEDNQLIRISVLQINSSFGEGEKYLFHWISVSSTLGAIRLFRYLWQE